MQSTADRRCHHSYFEGSFFLPQTFYISASWGRRLIKTIHFVWNISGFIRLKRLGNLSLKTPFYIILRRLLSKMKYLLQHFFVRPTRQVVQGVMFKFFSLIRNITEQVSYPRTACPKKPACVSRKNRRVCLKNRRVGPEKPARSPAQKVVCEWRIIFIARRLLSRIILRI